MANTAMGSPSNWGGYLLRRGDGTAFPHRYIKLDSYSTTPNIREEVKAYRDDYSRDLYRITATGTKSKISFETSDNLTLQDAYNIQNFFYAGEDIHLERKISITFWNMEYFRYDTAYFYRPDIEFKVRDIEDGDMTVRSLTITLVEY